jgi:choline dehydrogenase
MTTYDTIVVGAGSAGCALAVRLSEDPGTHVLLLEAGGKDTDVAIRMPIVWHPTSESNRYGWGFHTEPEEGIANRSLHQPRGKLLGGCSSINGMMYSRGNRKDYDGWAAMGLKGWSYDEVLPYFKRSESNWRGGDPFHGDSGPMRVESNPKEPGLYDSIIATAKRLGYRELDDFHGEEQEGFGMPDFTVRNGRRESSATAYLSQAHGRANLTVATEALATRVLFSEKRATGVEYRQAGELKQARGKEVILSGGAFNSPQLLLLSGIGPQDELRPLGIEVVHHLPAVGKNLQDHPLVAAGFMAAANFSFEKMLRFDRLALALLRWFVNGSGPLGTAPLSAQAYLRTRAESDYPDTQLQISHVSMQAKPWFPGISKGAGDQFTVSAMNLRPQGRGSLKLRSADPADTPEIRLGLMEHPADIEAARNIFKFIRQFFTTEPFAKLVQTELFPGEGVNSDEEIEGYLRHTMMTGAHPTSSCAMGTDSERSVVDAQLKVHGIEGLRVCDASVIPRIMAGNTNAPTIMIAEKAADLIRAGNN